MLAGMTGIARNSSSSRIWTSATTAVTDALPPSAAIARCSASRPVVERWGRSRWPRRDSGAGWSGRPRSACGSRRALRRRARRPCASRGRRPVSARRTDVDLVRGPRRVAASVRRRTSRRRARVATRRRPASRSALIASRRVTRLTPNVSASSRSGGSRSAVDQHAEPDALDQSLDGDLERVADRDGREDASAPRAPRRFRQPFRRSPTASIGSRAAAVDEAVEQGGAVVNLRVPLNADDPVGARSSTCLDRPVGRPSRWGSGRRRLGRIAWWW